MSQVTTIVENTNKPTEPSNIKKQKIAFVGIGHRAGSWLRPATTEYAEYAQVVGLCDPVKQRCLDALEDWQIDAPVFTNIDEMLTATRPDLTVITSPESVHREHIVKALQSGSRVATEKPLCVTGDDAQAILQAQQQFGQPILMGFNYRLMPISMKIKEIIMSGVIGRPLSVQLNWMLDYDGHGGSYFRRWHGQMDQSGGLLITKATHHFDLVNWWIGDRPKQVFAQCRLNRFGAAHSPFGSDHGTRCRDCHQAKHCHMFQQIDPQQRSAELGYHVKQVHDYAGDQCVWRPEIDIYDTHALTVEYANGCLLSYSLNATAPYEGWNMVVNGSLGRLEVAVEDAKPTMDWQSHFVILKHGPGVQQLPKDKYYVTNWPAEYQIHVLPIDQVAYTVKVPNILEGHGGGDRKIMHTAYAPIDQQITDDPLHTKASAIDGARSMAIGAAANLSTQLHRSVEIEEILGHWA